MAAASAASRREQQFNILSNSVNIDVCGEIISVIRSEVNLRTDLSWLA